MRRRLAQQRSVLVLMQEFSVVISTLEVVIMGAQVLPFHLPFPGLSQS